MDTDGESLATTDGPVDVRDRTGWEWDIDLNKPLLSCIRIDGKFQKLEFKGVEQIDSKDGQSKGNAHSNARETTREFHWNVAYLTSNSDKKLNSGNHKEVTIVENDSKRSRGHVQIDERLATVDLISDNDSMINLDGSGDLMYDSDGLRDWE
ncbi:hypothetical protein GQ457_16G008480 [Hibiscus cannabinus]